MGLVEFFFDPTDLRECASAPVSFSVRLGAVSSISAATLRPFQAI